MVVKSGKAYIFWCGLLLVPSGMFLVFCIQDHFAPWLSGSILFGAMAIIRFINCSRILIMDEGGCTVYLFHHKKRYLWDMFKVKRIERYAYYSGAKYGPQYNKVAIFSMRKIRKPRWKYPGLYYDLFPFSFICINMQDGEPGGEEGIFEVDEKEFREKMEEWNVEFEPEPQKKRKK